MEVCKSVILQYRKIYREAVVTNQTKICGRAKHSYEPGTKNTRGTEWQRWGKEKRKITLVCPCSGHLYFLVAAKKQGEIEKVLKKK